VSEPWPRAGNKRWVGGVEEIAQAVASDVVSRSHFESGGRDSSIRDVTSAMRSGSPNQMHANNPFVLTIVVCAAISVAERAEAAIGQSAESITADRQALSAAQSTKVTGNGFEVHEYQSHHTSVREYLSSSGEVFAVAWNGYVHPDLRVLLGAYAGEYQAALAGRPRVRGQRQRHLESQHLVVETWGHMRNLQGRAYAPGLLPPGVNVDAIR